MNSVCPLDNAEGSGNFVACTMPRSDLSSSYGVVLLEDDEIKRSLERDHVVLGVIMRRPVSSVCS